MFNEEATQWPSYVENKRGIPICIIPHILPRSAAHSLRLTLTIFSLISSNVEVKSEHL